jgi:hypothetical protein
MPALIYKCEWQDFMTQQLVVAVWSECDCCDTTGDKNGGDRDDREGGRG